MGWLARVVGLLIVCEHYAIVNNLAEHGLQELLLSQLQPICIAGFVVALVRFE